MPEAIFSPWIPVGALVALALAARRLLGSWLAPAAFVALVWSGYAGACLALTDYEVRAGGLWMIVGLVFSTQCGAMLSQTLGVRSTISKSDDGHEDQEMDIWIHRALPFSLLFGSMALAGTLYCVFWSVYRFNLSFSLLDLLSLGNMWSTVRYLEGGVEPWTVRLLTMWAYPAVLLGGIVFALAVNVRQRFLSFLPLVPVLLFGTVEATRAGSLIAFVCWLSSLFAIRYRETRGRYQLFRGKFALSLAAALLCGLAFFQLIDAVRVFRDGERLEITENVPRLKKYFFGPVPAFTGWFHTYTQQTPTFGAYTLAGAFDLLGVKRRLTGVYEDYHTVAGAEATNIYTAFRGLIQDFTPGGAVMFSFLIGLVAGAACRLQSHSSAFVLLSLYYAFTLYSPVISLLTYNGLILAWFVAAPILSWREHDRFVLHRP